MSLTVESTAVQTHGRAPVAGYDQAYTTADLAELPAELPSGPVCYELDNGRLVHMSPPGDLHGAYELNLAAQLRIQGQARGLGKARSGEVGIVLWRSPDRVVGADALFIANPRLPIRRSKEGYLETIPNLVVEVRSKNDPSEAVERKVADYLLAGVDVVWLVEPAQRRVVEHRPGREPRIWLEGEELTVEDVIPGFRMAVVDVFEE